MLKATEAREAHRKIVAATTEANEYRDTIAKANIKNDDREFIRARLKEAAEHIRKNYGLKIPVIKSFLHEMLDVAV